MKVLLCNPLYKYKLNNSYERYYIRSGTRWPHSGVKIIGKRPRYLPFPFSLAYSASILKNSGFDIAVIDAVALDMEEEKFLREISWIQPDVIFYEITAPTTRYDLKLAEKIKHQVNPIIVVGGAQATVFAEEIVNKYSQIDYVIKGEYETSLLKLLQHLNEGSSLPPGIVYKDGSQIISSRENKGIENLNDFPSPLWEYFPSSTFSDPTIYWDSFCQLRPAIQLQSSRGCHFNCYFCLYKQVMYKNRPYRTFSLHRVLHEIEYLKSKYNVREIYFDDDDFFADIDRAVDFSSKLTKEKIKIKWSCMGNINNLNKNILKLMAKSGCIGIKFGIESGSSKVLSQIAKTRNLEKLKELLKVCTKLGIKTQASFCFGLWKERKKDVRETLNLIKELDVDSFQLSFATPYPGTEFFKSGKGDKGLEGIDWEEFDGKRGKKIFSPFLASCDLYRFKQKAFYRWFLFHLLNPVWLCRHIKIIFRTLKGWGILFLMQNLISVFIDEWKNK